MYSLQEFFRHKRVFLTGHTGFKGAWLAFWLLEMDAHVHGYSLGPPTEPSLFEELGLKCRMTSNSVGDVRDRRQLQEALAAANPEIVFHLAAQPLVRRSYCEPHATFEINCLGTLNLLEAVRRRGGVRVCQVITSDKCYQNSNRGSALREDDPLGGADPYSASKACAELVAGAYRQSFFSNADAMSLATVRAGNVIGGGDWAEDRIIPDCVRALQEGRSIVVRNPDAVRPWQHVLEPLSGYLCLAAAQWRERALYSQAWNFGPLTQGHWSVRDIVAAVIHCWGQGSWHCPTPTAPAPHEAATLNLEISKALSMLPWQPVYSPTQAVRATVDWYKNRFDQLATFQAAEICRLQIAEYVAQAASQGVVWAQAKDDIVDDASA